MCNTKNGSGDDDRGDGVGEGSATGGCLISPTSKKPPKRQRVPKRGPGVAELEKILREQEHASFDHHRHRHQHQETVDQQGSFNPSHFRMSSSATSLSTTRSHNVVPPIMLSRPNSNHDNGSCTIRGGSGCGVFLPEQAALPVAWMADEGKSDGGFLLPSRSAAIPNAGMKRKQNCNNTTSMMNHFPGSTTSASNIPTSAGLCHQIEPPSSQTSCHNNYPSIWPHDKVIGVKRLPPPPVADDVSPLGHYQVPPVPSQSHRPDQPASFNHGIGYNPNLISKPTPRDAKLDLPPLEYNNYLQSYNNTELHGPPDGDVFRFGASRTSALAPPFQTLQIQTPKFDHPVPFQGSIRELTNQRPISAGLDQNRPFYSFLPSNEQQAKQTLRGLSIERGNKDGEDEIDLSLKLSTS